MKQDDKINDETCMNNGKCVATIWILYIIAEYEKCKKQSIDIDYYLKQQS
jgi:hypothetical protein